ncbi:hypothetical protein AB6N23_15080 [Cellulomonas sp. 179-A 9B4 NHS]|uniref:hypothetical protein n=1 Tax=Cellulomonas sp. 179-A 9B4 NHS TaxID=3142379 RepID=UPI0039A2A9D8
MSTTMWGPALDAELAYRRERVQDALGHGRTAARGRRRARTDAAAAPARAGVSRAPARRWVLPGSGAWHAAR